MLDLVRDSVSSQIAHLVTSSPVKSSGSLVIENLALRQQLAAYARCQKRVHVQPQERVFWVALSKVWAAWRSALIMVKPATVIAWHRRGFQRYWRWRSRKPGRPPIPMEHIALIRRISSDHSEWGEDRIAEKLAIKLGVHHSTSTIRKYMVSRRNPRDGQTWRTFVKNHAKQLYACDYLTQYTVEQRRHGGRGDGGEKARAAKENTTQQNAPRTQCRNIGAVVAP